MALLHGIVPPLVTPLLEPDRLDHESLRRLLHHVLEGGVHGVFILGTTGEAPHLSYRLRRELIEATCQTIDGRVPIAVGISDTSCVESLALAKVAADAGADAVVMAPPYYFPAGQTELVSLVRTMIARLPLPLVLYNMPSLTKVEFAPETLKVLADIDSIVGLKDSGGDIGYLSQVVALKALRPDWSVMVGPEHLLVEAMRLGADGGVSGGANLCPHWFANCYALGQENDTSGQDAALQQILGLQDIYTIGKYASRFIKGTKCALSLLGICGDTMAEPFHHFHPPERQRVRAILEQIGVGPLRE